MGIEQAAPGAGQPLPAWELGPASRAEEGTSVLFRHYGFGEGYAEIDLGHTAQTWALILDRLAGFLASDTPQPFFPAASA